MPAQERHDRFDAERRIAQHEVCTRTVDRFQIPLVCDAADDPQIGIEPAAIHRQVDVHRIIVGREQNRSRVENPRAFEQPAIRSIPAKMASTWLVNGASAASLRSMACTRSPFLWGLSL